MKRINFKLLFLLIFSLICLLAIVGCDDEELADCVHQWDKGVIQREPTCTENGTKLYTCTLCGETKTEVGGTEHKYKDNICTLCGTFNENAPNPSLTLIDSLFSANSYYLKGENIVVSVNSDTSYSFEMLEATVNITEDGYFDGSGVAKGTVNQSQPFDYSITLKDKSVFIYDGEALIKSYTQEQLIKMLPGSAFAALYGTSSTKNALLNAWEKLLGAENNMLEQKLDKLSGYIFNKTKTENGYLYTLNPSFTKTLFNNMKTQPINVFIDTVLGGGTYDVLLELAKGSIGTSISQIEKLAGTALEEYGISIDSLISAIGSLCNIDVEKELDEIKDKKIYELINLATGEQKTLEEYLSLIEEKDALFKSETLFDILIEPFLEKQLKLDYDTITEIVNTWIQTSHFRFTTNPSGELMWGSEQYDSFTFNETIDGYEINISVSGSIFFSLN